MQISVEPYLQRLTGQLIEGIERVPEPIRARHADWLRQQQNPDGGFSGREGPSDLYYTGFALRALAVLQALDETISEKASGFLSKQLSGQTGIVDFFSLLVGIYLVRLTGGPDVLGHAPSDWQVRVAEILERHRHADGGYAKTIGGSSGSTYTTFLVALALELLDRKMPHPELVVSFLEARHRNGGYVEIPQMKRAGTNPTAAGVGTMKILGLYDESACQRTADFLLPLMSPIEGGCRANDRIPAADLLSTFTASWTLLDIGMLDRLNSKAIATYAKSLQGPHGGFRGGSWDLAVDVEYTFYGLGVLALFPD
jgi:geranylgeranyl transferase type-2 subunit beta